MKFRLIQSTPHARTGELLTFGIGTRKVYNVAYDKVKLWCGLFTNLYFPLIIVQRLGAIEAARDLPAWTLKGGIIPRSFKRDRFALPPLTM